MKLDAPLQPASLTEQLIHSTVRIKTRMSDSAEWSAIGTGFYWNTPLGNGTEFSAIITNRHLLEDAVALGVQLHSKDPAGGLLFGPGQEVVIDGSALIPVFHADPQVDLALVPFGPTIHKVQPQPFFRALRFAELPSADDVESMRADQEILMVGYPVGLADETNNCPITRRGTTAVPPWLDYEGRKELLCDVPVFEGSSGSPVFVVHDGWQRLRNGTVISGVKKVFLIGVLRAGHSMNAEGQIISDLPKKGWVVIPQMINLGLCVKAERVRELVDQALSQFELTPSGEHNPSGL